MEYVDAMRWPAATQAPKEMRDAWGAAIVEFVFGSLYRHHVFNADPHPGNYLFHEDGTVTFLDFGCVRHFTPERVASIVRMRNAAVSGTDEEYIDALIAMGILREAPRDSSGLVAFARRDFSPLRAPQPFTYTKGWAADSLESMLDFRMGKDGPARQLNMPQDMVFLVRITAGLNSVLAGLGATVNFDELWPKILGDTA
jgi:predicted unusual protein kinase regulating ubiquinone biosynthesis (AarF/ABC1/UbiB family)